MRCHNVCCASSGGCPRSGAGGGGVSGKISQPEVRALSHCMVHNLKLSVTCCSASKLHLPSQQAGVLVLQRLLAGCRLATQTLPAAHAAAAQLLAQLSMTYFMPFCLTALSMVARVQVSLLYACHRGKDKPLPPPSPPRPVPSLFFSRPCPMNAVPQESLSMP